MSPSTSSSEIRPVLAGPDGLRHVVEGEPPTSLCGAALVSRSVDMWHVLPEGWRCPDCAEALSR